MCQQSHMSVPKGETVTLLEAIWFVESNKWEKVIFECDSSTLVNALSSHRHGNSEFQTIVSCIVAKLVYILTLR